MLSALHVSRMQAASGFWNAWTWSVNACIVRPNEFFCTCYLPSDSDSGTFHLHLDIWVTSRQENSLFFGALYSLQPPSWFFSAENANGPDPEHSLSQCSPGISEVASLENTNRLLCCLLGHILIHMVRARCLNFQPLPFFPYTFFPGSKQRSCDGSHRHCWLGKKEGLSSELSGSGPSRKRQKQHCC